MGFKVNIPDPNAGQGPVKTIVADTDLFLTADKSKAVADGPDAAFLLARAGTPVDAVYHELVTDKGKPKTAAKPKPKPKPKGKPKAKATKEVKPAADK